ncbi:MAG: T9SS type A sorting domain-containing protein [Saprospiraceae bacterium]|nr:T9SS type A sorting domain-containing protein [Saprospiraceae bacterium]
MIFKSIRLPFVPNAVFFIFLLPLFAYTQVVNIRIDPNQIYQTIDGFGAFESDADINASWWNDLYFEDMECSIYRVDLTPQLRSPYSDLSYYSPWFMGSAVKNIFNLEDPANPNGPEGNRVRTYTGPQDYSRSFGGRNAPIAVMGPNIEQNLQYFIYRANQAIQTGKSKTKDLGDFKLIGSIWSPLPWVKIASGNVYRENWWPGPVANTAWPFVWGGNFAGGRLDVSETPLQVFDDRSVGGAGATSALTQFARSTAAYILGYQRYYDVQFYAISIQNELNFEQFYNSATYPLSSQYIAAIKAVRKEFDKHPELQSIQIMGPEDLLGGDAYGMWEYGSSNGPIHKNLQYLQNIEADTAAKRALAFYCIHGYANDGVTSSGAQANLWNWWVNGWTASPAPGVPANVKGWDGPQKKSWMTETSGEHPDWIFPKSGYPGEGAFGLSVRIHQALTTGKESAWIYWTFSDTDNAGNVSLYGLTNATHGANAAKYVAAKHYFKFIRPRSKRIAANVSGSNAVLASAYFNEENKKMTIVMINTSSTTQTTAITLPVGHLGVETYTSKENNLWQKGMLQAGAGSLTFLMDPYSVQTWVINYPPTSSHEKIESIEYAEVIPNPFTQFAFLHLDLKEQTTLKLKIYDAAGHCVFEDEALRYLNSGKHQIKIELESHLKGVYFLNIESGFSSEFKKILIL